MCRTGTIAAAEERPEFASYAFGEPPWSEIAVLA